MPSRRLTKAGLVSSLGAIVAMAATLAVSAQSTVQEISGTLANGTAYNIHVPAGWDGDVLLLNADLPDNSNAIYRHLHQRGFATAGKQRNITEWRVSAGSKDVIELKNLFISKFTVPRTTILWGSSLGGLLTRDAVEAFPREFNGAVPMCGGGAGAIGMWNNRLDALFALKTLVAADDGALEIVRVTNEQQAIAALRAAVTKAMSTAAGRAKLALAAAVAQIDAWPGGAPAHPAPEDEEAQLGALASAYNAMLFSRAAIEKDAQGNLSWNAGVRYADMFNATGAKSRALAERLYKAAGLDLQADLRTLDQAPRIQADEHAVNWAIENGTHTGALELPVLSLFTAVDPRAALSEFVAYQRTVESAGKTALLRQAGVVSSGHCSFRPAEQAAALDLMLERVRTGQWDASPAALNARAARLVAASGGVLPAESRFAAFEGVVAFPRRFIAGRDRVPAAAVVAKR
jgi:hypothetical protein